VLDHGRLAQVGSHQELLAETGAYRRLWEIQGTLEDEIERDVSGAKS
jgi:ATP-binding cassette subfamily B protein